MILMNVLVLKITIITGVMTSKCVCQIVMLILVMSKELILLLVNSVILVLMITITSMTIMNGVYLIVLLKLILTIMMINMTNNVSVKKAGPITVIIVNTK
jgi:hypothetical protein